MNSVPEVDYSLVWEISVVAFLIVTVILSWNRWLSSVAKQLKTAKEELEKSEKKYRSIFENAIEGIFQSSVDGKLMSVNPSLARLFGYDHPEEMIRNISDVTRDCYVDAEVREEIKKILNENTQITDSEHLLKRKDGSLFWGSLSLRVVRGENAKPHYFEGTIIDITERKAKEAAIKGRKTAELANKAKSEFLANMSHEIRTPLNAIIGLSHLALQTPLSKKQQDYKEKIYHSSTLLLRLVDDILDFSKMEAGKLDFEKRVFSLEEVIEQLASLINVRIVEKGLGLEIDIAKSIRFRLLGDSLRLTQVLTNLTTNAVKFTRKGKISVRVELAGETEEEATLRFSVSDTGIGMDQEQIEQLFQPFQQVDITITRKYGGTGLGLVISKRLIEMMGGSIQVDSKLGVGTTFTFTACFGKTQHGAISKIKGVEGEEAEKLLAGSHLLVVEDNEINLQVARELLEKVGSRVSAVDNGKQAVERAAAERFDCILMDLQMPVMDGLTAAQEIRKGPARPDLPIIAMSANAITGTREQCLAAGMNDYITKPINPAILYETASRWIRPEAGRSLASLEDAPAASESASRKPSHGFPYLDGINVEAGLNFVDGDRDLYLMVLEKIYVQYRDTCKQIRTEVECGNLDGARAMVHTFKGLAGSIVAEKLHKSSIELEAALVNKATDRIPDLLDSLSREGERVMTTLESFLGGEDYRRLQEALTKGKTEEPKMDRR